MNPLCSSTNTSACAPVLVAFTLGPSWEQKKYTLRSSKSIGISRSKGVMEVKNFFQGLWFSTLIHASAEQAWPQVLQRGCFPPEWVVQHVWLKVLTSSFGNPLRAAAPGKGVLWDCEWQYLLRSYIALWLLLPFLFPPFSPCCSRYQQAWLSSPVCTLPFLPRYWLN